MTWQDYGIMGYGLCSQHPIGRLSTKKAHLFIRFRHATPVYFNMVPCNNIKNLGKVAFQTEKKPPMVFQGNYFISPPKRIQHKKQRYTMIFALMPFLFTFFRFQLFFWVWASFIQNSCRWSTSACFHWHRISRKNRSLWFPGSPAWPHEVSSDLLYATFMSLSFALPTSWWFQMLNF